MARATKRADGTSVDVTRVRVIDAGGAVVNVYLAEVAVPDITTTATLVTQA